MTKPSTTCPRCGAPLQPGTLDGLCAGCVQQVALLEASGVEENDLSGDSSPAQDEVKKAPGRWQPPALEEMQAMLPQYEFVAFLGRGGMGAVYKALQVSLERVVAIKVLPPDLREDDELNFVERFKNEARTMAKMNHPAIVDVYEFGRAKSGLLFIAMEFIDGTDAARLILLKKCIPPYHALAITARVCDALTYAHSLGVIHRDIKPANILISRQGEVKVADFGLAKLVDPEMSGMTRSNVVMGSPDFLAPEAMIPGIPLDTRADLYAVGVTLYQMLTGEIPRGMWMMPGMLPGIDPRFDFVIGRAMQKDRRLRYQKASEIRRDLHVIMTAPLPVAGAAISIPYSYEQRNASKGEEETLDGQEVGKLSSNNAPTEQKLPQAGTARARKFFVPIFVAMLSVCLFTLPFRCSPSPPAPVKARPNGTDSVEAGIVPAPVLLGRSRSKIAYELPQDRFSPVPWQTMCMHFVASTGVLAHQTEGGNNAGAAHGDRVLEWHNLARFEDGVVLRSFNHSPHYSPVYASWSPLSAPSVVRPNRSCLDFRLRAGVPSAMSLAGMSANSKNLPFEPFSKESNFAYPSGVTVLVVFQAHAPDLPTRVCTLSGDDGTSLSLCVDLHKNLVVEVAAGGSVVAFKSKKSQGLDGSLPCIASICWEGSTAAVLLQARNATGQKFTGVLLDVPAPTKPIRHLQLGRVVTAGNRTVAVSDCFSGLMSEIAVFSAAIRPDQVVINVGRLADYYFQPIGRTMALPKK